MKMTVNIRPAAEDGITHNWKPSVRHVGQPGHRHCVQVSVAAPFIQFSDSRCVDVVDLFSGSSCQQYSWLASLTLLPVGRDSESAYRLWYCRFKTI